SPVAGLQLLAPPTARSPGRPRSSRRCVRPMNPFRWIAREPRRSVRPVVLAAPVVAPSAAEALRPRAATSLAAICSRPFGRHCVVAGPGSPRAWQVLPISSTNRQFPALFVLTKDAPISASHTDFSRCRVPDRPTPPNRAPLRHHRLRRRPLQTQPGFGGTWLRPAAETAKLSARWESRPSTSAGPIAVRPAPWPSTPPAYLFRNRRSPAPGPSTRAPAAGRRARSPDPATWIGSATAVSKRRWPAVGSRSYLPVA